MAKKGRKSAVSDTRVKITKKGKILFENKTNPVVEMQIKVGVKLRAFDGDTDNIYDMKAEDLLIFYRRQYLSKKKADNDDEKPQYMMKWSRWELYPTENIVFVGKRGE